MPNPERLSALIAEKKPPMLQPNASIAPRPIKSPPPVPLISSPRGGTRIANSRLSNAPVRPPSSTPRFSSEPEYSQGATRSVRWARPRPRSIQSPQLRRPSEAVHGRSNAKRNTLIVAIKNAALQMGHGRPKTAVYWAESAEPISGRSLRALDEEAEHDTRLRLLDDSVARAARECLEVRRRPGIGGQDLQHTARLHVRDGPGDLQAGPRTGQPPAVHHDAGAGRGWRGGGRRRLASRDAVAGLGPRRHAAGDVVEPAEPLALQRADHRARPKAARAQHRLGPVVGNLRATGHRLEHRQVKRAVDVALVPFRELAHVDDDHVAALLEPGGKVMHGDLRHRLQR